MTPVTSPPLVTGVIVRSTSITITSDSTPLSAWVTISANA